MGETRETTKPTLTKPTRPSFRLRNESLNTLRLLRVFDVFDRNHDGDITTAELLELLTALGLTADEPTLSSIVATHLSPGKASLDFDAFKALHRSLAATEEDYVSPDEDSDMVEAFRVFDENGDGFISAAELQRVLGKLGLVEGTELGKVQDMICSADRNNDGRVDFNEFKVMMQNCVSVFGI